MRASAAVARPEHPRPVAPRGALERGALEWIGDYWNAVHLRRTCEWAVALRPSVGAPLRLAALTHDIERRVPGGPRLDAWRRAWDDPDYLRAHSERSAALVDAWLADARAGRALRDEVSRLILEHEVGGSPGGDVIQAADSLSFLEVNGELPQRWVRQGRCPQRKARAKLDWMLERIRVPRARELADPLHRRAVARLR